MSNILKHRMNEDEIDQLFSVHDALTTSLDRAEAVITLLSLNFTQGATNQASDRVVENALNSVNAELCDIREIFRNYIDAQKNPR